LGGPSVFAESSNKSTIQDAVVCCPAGARVCSGLAEAGSAEEPALGAPPAGVKVREHRALVDEKELVSPRDATVQVVLPDEV
jgi:hypothetical protein